MRIWPFGGLYAVPEFDQFNFKFSNSLEQIVESSKLRGYPESGIRMKSSRSLPHILEDVKPVQNKKNKDCKSPSL